MTWQRFLIKENRELLKFNTFLFYKIYLRNIAFPPFEFKNIGQFCPFPHNLPHLCHFPCWDEYPVTILAPEVEDPLDRPVVPPLRSVQSDASPNPGRELSGAAEAEGAQAMLLLLLLLLLLAVAALAASVYQNAVANLAKQFKLRHQCDQVSDVKKRKIDFKKARNAQEIL